MILTSRRICGYPYHFCGCPGLAIKEQNGRNLVFLVFPDFRLRNPDFRRCVHQVFILGPRAFQWYPICSPRCYSSLYTSSPSLNVIEMTSMCEIKILNENHDHYGWKFFWEVNIICEMATFQLIAFSLEAFLLHLGHRVNESGWNQVFLEEHEKTNPKWYHTTHNSFSGPRTLRSKEGYNK